MRERGGKNAGHRDKDKKKHKFQATIVYWILRESNIEGYSKCLEEMKTRVGRPNHCHLGCTQKIWCAMRQTTGKQVEELRTSTIKIKI